MNSIINNEIRVFLISLAIQYADLRTIDMGLVRQKRMWWLHLFMISKTMMLVTVANILHLYGLDETWWGTFYIGLDVLVGVTMNVLFVILWEGEVLHILLIGAAGELVACPVLLVVMLMNKLENRSQLAMIEGPFMPLDLLIPIGVLAFFYLIRPLLKRIMQFLGNLRLPFRGLWWVLFIAYFFYEHMSAFLYRNNLKEGGSAFIVGEAALMLVLLLMLLAFFLWYNAAVQKQEEKMLSMQLRLIRQRAAVVQNGRSEAEAMRKLITSQMERIQVETAEDKSPDANEIEDYLRQLGQIKMPEYRGRYCRDVLVDEMLSQISENAKRDGRRINILVQQYDRGRIDEEDLVRLLYFLQETVKEPGDVEELALSTAGNQFFIRMRVDSFAFSRGTFAAMQRILRKYKGTIDITNVGRSREAAIMLPRESKCQKRTRVHGMDY